RAGAGAPGHLCRRGRPLRLPWQPGPGHHHPHAGLCQRPRLLGRGRGDRGRFGSAVGVGRDHEQGTRAVDGGATGRAGGTVIAVIDNYDSFTYNLVQYLGTLGAEVFVRRNDQVTVKELEGLKPDGLLISPGPGEPRDAGVTEDAIRALSGHVPILGV